MQLQLCLKEKLSGAGRPCSLVPLLGPCAASLDTVSGEALASPSYPVLSRALEFSVQDFPLSEAPWDVLNSF